MKKYSVPILIVVISGALIFTLYKTNVLSKTGLFGAGNLTSQSNKSKISEPLKGTTKIKTNQATKAETSPKEVEEINGLVSIPYFDDSILIDLKYATTDNFTGKVIYPVAVCVLQRATAQKLSKANDEFKKLGYKIKIWDAYRPVYVQQIFWDIVKDSRFVANPATGGSIHNRGTAVDLTLVDSNGNELKMPSKFDDFTTNAYRTNSKIDSIAKKNMDLLTDVMKRNGFNTIDTEWWHFEDSNSNSYKIVNVKLDNFLKRADTSVTVEDKQE